MTADLASPERSGLACAEAHPLADDVLCRRLIGHPGPRSADGLSPWTDTPNDEET